MDRPAVCLSPKSSSISGQLHLSNPRALQQQNPPQSNIPHETQLPITHLMYNVPPPLNPLVNPPHFIPPYQLVNPQLPLIPSSIPASNLLPVPIIAQKNTVHSPQAHLVPFPEIAPYL